MAEQAAVDAAATMPPAGLSTWERQQRLEAAQSAHTATLAPATKDHITELQAMLSERGDTDVGASLPMRSSGLSKAYLRNLMQRRVKELQTGGAGTSEGMPSSEYRNSFRAVSSTGGPPGSRSRTAARTAPPAQPVRRIHHSINTLGRGSSLPPNEADLLPVYPATEWQNAPQTQPRWRDSVGEFLWAGDQRAQPQQHQPRPQSAQSQVQQHKRAGGGAADKHVHFADTSAASPPPPTQPIFIKPHDEQEQQQQQQRKGDRGNRPVKLSEYEERYKWHDVEHRSEFGRSLHHPDQLLQGKNMQDVFPRSKAAHVPIESEYDLSFRWPGGRPLMPSTPRNRGDNGDGTAAAVTPQTQSSGVFTALHTAPDARAQDTEYTSRYAWHGPPALPEPPQAAVTTTGVEVDTADLERSARQQHVPFNPVSEYRRRYMAPPQPEMVSVGTEAAAPHTPRAYEDQIVLTDASGNGRPWASEYDARFQNWWASDGSARPAVAPDSYMTSYEAAFAPPVSAAAARHGCSRFPTRPPPCASTPVTQPGQIRTAAATSAPAAPQAATATTAAGRGAGSVGRGEEEEEHKRTLSAYEQYKCDRDVAQQLRQHQLDGSNVVEYFESIGREQERAAEEAASYRVRQRNRNVDSRTTSAQQQHPQPQQQQQQQHPQHAASAGRANAPPSPPSRVHVPVEDERMPARQNVAGELSPKHRRTHVHQQRQRRYRQEQQQARSQHKPHQPRQQPPAVFSLPSSSSFSSSSSAAATAGSPLFHRRVMPVDLQAQQSTTTTRQGAFAEAGDSRAHASGSWPASSYHMYDARQVPADEWVPLSAEEGDAGAHASRTFHTLRASAIGDQTAMSGSTYELAHETLQRAKQQMRSLYGQ
ncbi:hypothetical protein PTSG_07649 [Salpingoeca rosetta]|uniref:Uncharacterized protein n=1 Tax=Salpingoeca rosetta (strain ATCC 50818 / BSB-021) TaxID=946362 RepID=F2UHD3_SALR5|nr:uncharacterized protein PTSG_07649 [Salpingoeca rosetta]EGD76532.1 hypothetical protein PTSG_07649 [Salpingoeca rosetta]|eukprot:XP_004991446.1 hypothetical protein PTSG_07649 [Salpingoeca rosetta]